MTPRAKSFFKHPPRAKRWSMNIPAKHDVDDFDHNGYVIGRVEVLRQDL